MDAERRARSAFAATFGRIPAAIARAPGRVNLIGEHIDYCGGHVLPFAIDRSCVVAAAATSLPRLSVFASDLGERIELPLDGDLRAERGQGPIADGSRVRMGSWASYVVGVAAGVLGTRRDRPGADLAIASDVPIGAGLASSAALEVATAMVLARVWGLELSAMEICHIGREAERAFAGVPCGIMDQYASAIGREGHAVLIDCASERWELVPVPPREHAALLVIDTGVRHALATNEYANRRAACESASRKLGVRWLCAATGASVRAATGTSADILTDDEARAARHATTEDQRTLAATRALRADDLPHFGRLMNESHASLREDYLVSCPELDVVVQAAMSVDGVFGARMTGGGFGGCAIALIRPDALDAARHAIGAAFRPLFTRDCGFMVVAASNGATCTRLGAP